MKRTKQEIIQELIKELSEASDNIVAVKNNTGEQLIIGVSGNDNRMTIEITKSLPVSSTDCYPTVLEHNDSLVIESFKNN